MQCQRLQQFVMTLQCRGLTRGGSAADADDLREMMRWVLDHGEHFGQECFHRNQREVEQPGVLETSGADEEDLSQQNNEMPKAVRDEVTQRRPALQHLPSKSDAIEDRHTAAMRKVEALHAFLARDASLPEDILLDKIELEIDLQDVFKAFVKTQASCNGEGLDPRS